MSTLALIKRSVLIAEDMVVAEAAKEQTAQIERDLEQERKRKEIYDQVHVHLNGRWNQKP